MNIKNYNFFLFNIKLLFINIILLNSFNIELYSQDITGNILKNIDVNASYLPNEQLKQLDYLNNNTKYFYPDLSANSKKLARNTKLFFSGAMISAGILYLMPENITNWDKNSMSFSNIFHKWKQNVSSGPVIDKDNWVLNYVAHPYCGAIYYMSARSLDYSVMTSFLYSAAISTFAWEYGFEALAEVPSTQDLIITPICGSILGELFHIAKKNIIQKDYKILNSKFLGHFTIFLLDPFNEISDLLIKEKYISENKQACYVSLTPQFNINKIQKLEYSILISVYF